MAYPPTVYFSEEDILPVVPKRVIHDSDVLVRVLVFVDDNDMPNEIVLTTDSWTCQHCVIKYDWNWIYIIFVTQCINEILKSAILYRITSLAEYFLFVFQRIYFIWRRYRRRDIINTDKLSVVLL